MVDRRVELILAEALRHRGLALLDEPRRLEHLEVAEALVWAAETIKEECTHEDPADCSCHVGTADGATRPTGRGADH